MQGEDGQKRPPGTPGPQGPPGDQGKFFMLLINEICNTTNLYLPHNVSRESEFRTFIIQSYILYYYI